MTEHPGDAAPTAGDEAAAAPAAAGPTTTAGPRRGAPPDSLRGRVRDGLERLGLGPATRRVALALLWLRSTPAERRNVREDRLIPLVAIAALRSDSNCIDIGTNEAQLLQRFVEIAPEGHHLAFEPVPALAEELRRRFPAVDVAEAALADRSGTETLVVHRGRPSRSSLRPVGYAAEEVDEIPVEVARLDDVLPAGYVPALIKIDVEGGELAVLRGALATLRAHRPVVLFEHQRATADPHGARAADVHALLVDDVGLRIFDLDGAGPYDRAEFVAAVERDRHVNYLAVP